jgi:putative spermidine/putrescine transport system substrate-binding protein
MTNANALEYASSHTDEFRAGEVAQIADIAQTTRRKFAQGGTWQNRWPSRVEVYENEWARFKSI